MLQKASKILVIRFSSIGDIILTTPVLEWLKHNNPGCAIHYLTLSEFAPLLEENPFVERIIQMGKETTVRQLRRLARVIGDSEYDLIVDLHNSLRSKYIRRALTGTKWVVYKKPRWKRFLLFYFHIDTFDTEYDIPVEYLKSIKKEAQMSLGSVPRLFLSSQEVLRAQLLLTEKGVGGAFVAVIPGSAWRWKMWNIAGYLDVVKVVSEKFGAAVVLLGGKRDIICDRLSDELPKVINLKGDIDLRSALAVLSLARVAIGTDTGMIHGAEAIGTPVIMIKGPTSRQTGARTHLSESIELTSNPWCRPCSKNGSRPCYRIEQVCLLSVTAAQVIENIRPFVATS